MEKFFGFNVS